MFTLGLGVDDGWVGILFLLFFFFFGWLVGWLVGSLRGVVIWNQLSG